MDSLQHNVDDCSNKYTDSSSDYETIRDLIHVRWHFSRFGGLLCVLYNAWDLPNKVTGRWTQEDGTIRQEMADDVQWFRIAGHRQQKNPSTLCSMDCGEILFHLACCCHSLGNYQVTPIPGHSVVNFILLRICSVVISQSYCLIKTFLLRLAIPATSSHSLSYSNIAFLSVLYQGTGPSGSWICCHVQFLTESTLKRATRERFIDK